METEIKSNILDRKRRLVINADEIEFDDSSWKNVPATQFPRGTITAFRFGVEFIWGYRFIIGRKYCIDIKALDDRVIRIRLISVYGIRKRILHEKFNQILDIFFDTHHNDMVNYYLEIIDSRIEVNILETAFSNTGIRINGKNIDWKDVGTKSYTSYYALYSRKQPTLCKRYHYLSDWNAAVVYSISEKILAQKRL